MWGSTSSIKPGRATMWGDVEELEEPQSGSNDNLVTVGATADGVGTLDSLVVGAANYITSSDSSGIVGGNQNTIVFADRSVILGGLNNTATHRDCTILNGHQARTYCEKSVLYNNGLMGVDGTAHMTMYMLVNETSIAGFNTLYLDYPTNTQQIVLPEFATGSIWLRGVAGRNTINQASCFRVEYTFNTDNQTLTAASVNVHTTSAPAPILNATTSHSISLVANVLTIMFNILNPVLCRMVAHVHILHVVHRIA